MKKYLQVAIIVAVLGFCNMANAEQSGGFLGAEIGYGNLEVPFDYNSTNESLSGKFSGGGVDFGVMGGYKQFFHPYFGLRYYANVNVVSGKVSQKNIQGNLILTAGDNRPVTLVNYGVNIDMLINFIVRESVWNQVADFGAFVGVGVGGNSWSGKAIQDIDDYVVVREQNLNQSLGWKTTRNFLDTSLNVGLRTNILTHHGLELAFRVSLYKNTFLDKQKSFNNTATATFKVHTKTPSYAITLRYVYAFEPPKIATREAIENHSQVELLTTQDTDNLGADSADLIDLTATESNLKSTQEVEFMSESLSKHTQETQIKAEPQDSQIDSSKKSDELVNPCGNYKCIYKINPR